MKKRILATLLALCMALALLPSALADGSIWPEPLEPSQYTLRDGVLTIQDGVKGIKDQTFNSNTQITSVILPDSVEVIGVYAFMNCSNLTSVTIPSGITIIGDGAFQDCESLTNVTILSSVTRIEWEAFADCTSLTSVTIPSGVTSIGGRAFAETPWLENLGEFPIVNGILIAYQGPGGDVTIPSGVTSIGEGSFAWCENLTSVTIPSGVTEIGAQAFYGCTGLTSVAIPSSVTSIERYAFTRLTDVYYGGSEAQWNAINFKWDLQDAGLDNATIHYNSAMPGAPVPTAHPAPQTVKLDGEGVTFYTYQIGGYNYVKLRDLAYALNGTAAQFEVGYDNATRRITLTTGKAYTPASGEMAPIPNGEQPYEPCASDLLLNGEAVELEAYTINGYNYFKLRDLGQAMDFNVSWIDNGVVIASGEPYSDAN